MKIPSSYHNNITSHLSPKLFKVFAIFDVLKSQNQAENKVLVQQPLRHSKKVPQILQWEKMPADMGCVHCGVMMNSIWPITVLSQTWLIYKMKLLSVSVWQVNLYRSIYTVWNKLYMWVNKKFRLIIIIRKTLLS